jgi:predicted negative regulator of RcsB-dependent stress response
VYIANNKPDQALTSLNGAQPGNFSSQYNELKGDIYALQGKNEDARRAYQQALAESGSGAFDPALIDLKLNSLD